MDKADTCRTYVLPNLKSAGWEDEAISEQMVLTPGRIVPVGEALHKIQGQATKSREVYFALYQALSGTVEGPNLYERYPRDFFDLIVVDECHRRSAKAAREILDGLLEKYADYGINQLDDLPNLLQVQPFTQYGSPSDIYALFGGAGKLVQAVDELEKSLYE